MTEHIKQGPSLGERFFKVFEKSWQIIFIIYWYWPSIKANFIETQPPEDTTETPVEPVPESW